ncbi:MAG TPA: hypothetical protein PK196_04960 [Methanoculleus sp.]|nr:hypothetical protein [Methanoculleus sp.]
MERSNSGADRCSAGAPGPRVDRKALLEEIAAFTHKYGDILARYHRYTMDELKQIEQECWALHDKACSMGACGSAGVLAELEYLITTAKEMRARMDESRG